MPVSCELLQIAQNSDQKLKREGDATCPVLLELANSLDFPRLWQVAMNLVSRLLTEGLFVRMGLGSQLGE
jgi:hypothetical protein